MTDSIWELLQKEPREIRKGYGPLFGCYYTHVPEVSSLFSYIDPATAVACDLVEIHEFHHAWSDARRYWTIFGVKFEGEWVMVCRNAGREGDDFYDRFIIDPKLYRKMAITLAAVLAAEEARKAIDDPPGYRTPTEIRIYERTHEVEPHGEVSGLYQFYGHDVRETYERW